MVGDYKNGIHCSVGCQHGPEFKPFSFRYVRASSVFTRSEKPRVCKIILGFFISEHLLTVVNSVNDKR